MAHHILRWLIGKPRIPTESRQAASPTDSSHGKDQALRHTASDSDEDIYLLPAPSENVGQGQGSNTPPAKLPAALLAHLKATLTLCCQTGQDAVLLWWDFCSRSTVGLKVWTHLLLFLRPKYSYYNRKPCGLEFCMRAKEFCVLLWELYFINRSLLTIDLFCLWNFTNVTAPSGWVLLTTEKHFMQY